MTPKEEHANKETNVFHNDAEINKNDYFEQNEKETYAVRPSNEPPNYESEFLGRNKSDGNVLSSANVQMSAVPNVYDPTSAAQFHSGFVAPNVNGLQFANGYTNVSAVPFANAFSQFQPNTVNAMSEAQMAMMLRLFE